MIIKIFDNGWGPEFPAKQFEQQLLDQMLKQIHLDQSHTVLINSVWYTKEYHQQTLDWIKKHKVDHIILISMLDPPIPDATWYADLNCKVTQIGYYAGEFFIDYWALVMHKNWNPVDQDLLMNPGKIDLAFMCLNRKPHWHRKKLYNELDTFNLLDQGIVSMGQVKKLLIDTGHDNLAPNPGTDEYGIPNDLITLGHIDNWQRCFLNVVTETVYDVDQQYFVSEKIYKPIIGCRPFLVYAPNGAINWLKTQGFESYVDDFGDITDLDLKNPNNLSKFLQILCEQSASYWQHKFVALKDKIVYNKTHFDIHVQRQKQTIEKGIQCQI